MTTTEGTLAKNDLKVSSREAIASCSYFTGSRGRLYMADFPALGESCGVILYVHPFAAEASHSRRVITDLARQLSHKNYRTIIVDHYGCGDSEGDFRDARWEIWRDDLLSVCRWLGEEGHRSVTLWGLRMGALLATEVATLSPLRVERLLLWQPVLSGAPMLNTFVRSNLNPEDVPAGLAEKLSDAEQRRSLSLSEPVNIDGYMLSPELIRALDAAKLETFGARLSAPVHWLRVLRDDTDKPSPGSERLIQNWRARGLQVETDEVISWPVWSIPSTAKTTAFNEPLNRAFPDA